MIMSYETIEMRIQDGLCQLRYHFLLCPHIAIWDVVVNGDPLMTLLVLRSPVGSSRSRLLAVLNLDAF